jgi:hypothetical protein
VPFPVQEERVRVRETPVPEIERLQATPVEVCREILDSVNATVGVELVSEKVNVMVAVAVPPSALFDGAPIDTEGGVKSRLRGFDTIATFPDAS